MHIEFIIHHKFQKTGTGNKRWEKLENNSKTNKHKQCIMLEGLHKGDKVKNSDRKWPSVPQVKLNYKQA